MAEFGALEVALVYEPPAAATLAEAPLKSNAEGAPVGSGGGAAVPLLGEDPPGLGPSGDPW